MLLNDDEAKRILSKVKEYSKADSFETGLSGSNINNIRFALNSVSTSGYSDSLSLYIRSNIGKKSGVVTINMINDTEIKNAVDKSESIARLSPDNQEFVLPLNPQEYDKSINFVKSTEDMYFEKRAMKISPILDSSLENSTEAAGYWEDESGFYSILNSNGLFAYNKGTLASFSATVRSKDGNGSSRVQNQYVDVDMVDVNSLTNKVIRNSLLSKNPRELVPGKYTVILEPAAAADLVANLTWFMDSRGADEGRSFFSRPGGGNKIGEKIVNEKVNIYSDPIDPNCPSIPFTDDGYPRNKTIWVEHGVLRNLTRSRFWAQKTNQPVVPYYSNLLMDGSDKSVEDLISTTDHAILVTRFWYIRAVDPQTILLTGLTRDGLFEIRDGKISNPIKNFRFNESPINMLNNVLEIGKSENAVGSETGDSQIFVPSLKVKDFNFSSLSDAI